MKPFPSVITFVIISVLLNLTGGEVKGRIGTLTWTGARAVTRFSPPRLRPLPLRLLRLATRRTTPTAALLARGARTGASDFSALTVAVKAAADAVESQACVLQSACRRAFTSPSHCWAA